MRKTKPKVLLFALVTLFSALIFGGLVFGLGGNLASANSLPDRYDPARDTMVNLVPLPASNNQVYYADGYYLVQNKVSKTLTNDDTETTSLVNAINAYANTSYTANFNSGSVRLTNNLDGYNLVLNGGSPTAEETTTVFEKLTFTLVQDGKISFVVKKSAEDNNDNFYFVLDNDENITIDDVKMEVLKKNSPEKFEVSLSAPGTYNCYFAYCKNASKNVDNDLIEVSNLKFGALNKKNENGYVRADLTNYTGDITAIANYEKYEAFAWVDTGTLREQGNDKYSSLNGSFVQNQGGKYYKTIEEAVSDYNEITTENTTFNLVILDDIEIENELTFNNTNVIQINVHTDDNDTLRSESNPYIIENVNGGSIFDFEALTSAAEGASEENYSLKFDNNKSLKFITEETYSIKLNENEMHDGSFVFINGSLMFESMYSDILSHETYLYIDNNAKLASVNKTTFSDDYVINSTGYGHIAFTGSNELVVNLTNKSFIKIDKTYINYSKNYSKITCNISGTGVDHDIYISGIRDNGRTDTLSIWVENETNTPLRVKFSDVAFNHYANNYDYAVGQKRDGVTDSFDSVFAYYQQSEDVGYFAFREVYNADTERFEVYLLENVGVTFDYNIPEYQADGVSGLRTLVDSNGKTTERSSPISEPISVPYGFDISGDKEFKLDEYDVYSYKFLGWSSNPDVYNQYCMDTANLISATIKENNTATDEQITKAFVNGSGKDNYGYSAANNKTLADGTVQHYITFKARWYRFLGDTIEDYDDEDTDLTKIFYGEELIYLSQQLSSTLEESDYRENSYAVMRDLNLTLYGDYYKDDGTSTTNWVGVHNYLSANPEHLKYLPMAQTEGTAFIGKYFVGLDENASLEEKTITLSGSALANSNNQFVLTSTHENSALGGLFGYASNEDGLISHIDFDYEGLTLLRTANIEEYTGGLVGCSTMEISNCSVLNCVVNVPAPSGLKNYNYIGGLVGKTSNNLDTCVSTNINISASGYSYVGGVVGYFNGNTITNTHATVSGVSGFNYVGGIAGNTVGEIYNCSVTSTSNFIFIRGESNTGGVVGWSSASVQNCQNSSSVTGSYYTGGVVGWSSASVQNCTNSGTIKDKTGVDASGIGGVAGYISSSDELTISGCSNTGTINIQTSSSVQFIGGVFGYISGGKVTIEGIKGQSSGGSINANNSANVQYIGGVIGRVECTDTSSYINNYSYGGVVSAPNGLYIGGIIGGSLASVQNCTLTDTVVTGCSNVGGIAGLVSNATIISGNKVQDNSSITGNNCVGGVVGIVNPGSTEITDNHSTFSTITCDSGDNAGGVFARVDLSGGSIKNCTNSSKVSCVGTNTGGIVGYSNVAISNCSNNYDVNIETNITSTCTPTGDNWGAVGGIVGWIDNAEIFDCTNNCAVSSTTRGIGGIAGVANGSVTIRKCSNSSSASITGSGAGYVGGIVGYAKGSVDIGDAGDSNSGVNNAANVNGTLNVGGIVGCAGAKDSSNQPNIYFCTNNGIISFSGTATDATARFGGIVGQCYGKVVKSVNNGIVNAYHITGGIVGALEDTGNLDTNTNNANVTGADNVGGIAGWVYNVGIGDTQGTLTVSGRTNVGGYYGSVNSTCDITISNTTVSVTATGNTVGGIVGYAEGVAFVGSSTGRNITITSTTSGAQEIGGIVGCIANFSTLGNTETGNINNATIKASSATNVGGVVGKIVNSTATKAENFGYILGHTNVGGIVGLLETSSLTSCENGGYVTNVLEAANAQGVGGIAGFSSGSTITSCENNTQATHLIEASRQNYEPIKTDYMSVWGRESVGGILGYGTNTTITYCVNNGYVQGGWYYASAGYYTMGDDVGGLVGYLTGTASSISGDVDNCAVKGNSNVGGIAGSVYGTSEIMVDVYGSDVEVYGKANCIGGVVGNANNVHVIDSFSSSSVITGLEETGGIIGYAANTILESTTCRFGRISGTNYTSGAIGYGVSCTIKDVVVKVGVDAGLIIGADYTGGIIGYATGCTIEDSEVRNTFDSQENRLILARIFGNSYVGGIAGYIEGDGYATTTIISNVTNYVMVDGEPTASGREHVGGLVGYLRTGAISSSNNYGNTRGRKNVGGIVGTVYNGSVSSCTVQLYTTVAAFYGDAGGIVGQATGSRVQITNCKVKGLTSSTAIQIISRGGAAGGILGSASSDSIHVAIYSCSVSGTKIYSTGYASSVVGYFYTRNTSGAINNNTSTTVDVLYGTAHNLSGEITKIIGYCDAPSGYVDTSSHTTSSVVLDSYNNYYTYNQVWEWAYDDTNLHYAVVIDGNVAWYDVNK